MAASLLALGASEVLKILNSMLLLFGGVAAFIIGMNMMGGNLETAAGKSMRRLMAKATKNRFLGVGTGAAVTAIVTSSSATTVMIVGFVNVGLMTLTQAASIIMGANIGTTITAFITAVSTAGAEFEVTALFAFVAFVGVLMSMLGKTDKITRRRLDARLLQHDLRNPRIIGIHPVSPDHITLIPVIPFQKRNGKMFGVYNVHRYSP